MGVSSFLHPSAPIYSEGFPSWLSWTSVHNTSEACGAAAMQWLLDEKLCTIRAVKLFITIFCLVAAGI